jgi:hypothetical protein
MIWPVFLFSLKIFHLYYGGYVMPHNKRESLIYTVIMCFTMVLWMSFYNVAIQQGGISTSVFTNGWLGFPPAYLVAMCLDWFVVSKAAKGFAFRFLVKPDSSDMKKIIAISSCMVVGMVFFMSLYGAAEGCVHSGEWNRIFINWLVNIPRNFIMALPFQLLVAGPIVRRVFRLAFPVGCVQA